MQVKQEQAYFAGLVGLVTACAGVAAFSVPAAVIIFGLAILAIVLLVVDVK